MVATVFWSDIAEKLIEFADKELAETRPGEYRIWDSYLGIYLRHEKSIRNGLPFRNYGEHGGLARSEHTRHGIRAWHQADRLLGRLAFLPPYAQGSQLRYRLIRLRAWSRGLFRLVSGRYLPYRYASRSRNFGRLVHFAWSRLLSP
jgi:hypothetical protein